ncbi:winged helix-turn-helix domain-containing protein [Streptomyces sp. NPDC091281]|uniref:winged helix-turn-helix domain-containing protein n=1 Tax=Streptomyces sp. NPDC091281 TaxID=3365985 RepID=UPI00381D332C
MGDQQPIDPSRPVYVWQQVADHIARRIQTGELRAGARLEGERELAEHLGVAVGTVRRAIEDLRERGLVVTLAAKGTYIANDPAEETGQP